MAKLPKDLSDDPADVELANSEDYPPGAVRTGVVSSPVVSGPTPEPTVHDGIAELDAKLAKHNTSVVGLLTHFAKTAFGIVLK